MFLLVARDVVRKEKWYQLHNMFFVTFQVTHVECTPALRYWNQ